MEMPPDLVYVAQNDPAQYRPGIPRGIRNGSRDDGGEGSHSREIELKRSRGEISCAECRRFVQCLLARRVSFFETKPPNLSPHQTKG